MLCDEDLVKAKERVDVQQYSLKCTPIIDNSGTHWRVMDGVTGHGGL